MAYNETARAVTRLAIYDMDRTITFRGTYTPFLLHVATHMAPWRLIFAPVVPFIMIAYVLRFISRRRLKEMNQALMIGGRVSRARLQPHIESFARKVMERNVRPGALAQVAADRAAGYRLVLATASYRLYVEAIARLLGFDAVIATDHLGQGLDYVRARIAGDNCYDAAKLGMIQAWMVQHDVHRNAAHIRAYSDHVSDAPMLEYADEAFAANPHPPLAKLAQERGWTRVDWG
ncbi:HAD family hydrolase [Sphingobium subterraneum]|uniref:HAD superfamily phosphoserine phosphatase-like hydrolase n=1 Tax=Sphingobium subterraneum TaxID=627688 RepID=A0A841J1S3_9SPHN|nr:HAD superfamily phosphoserine phosphatase-like hydrolase [Sphingobium subterraneum]